jgi:hypothetical protein
MWWIPLASAVALGLFVALLHVWHQRRQNGAAKTYRARFVQLVAQLDTLTGAVNQLAEQVPQVTDPKVLDFYESTLRILETLLSAVRRIPPFGDDPGSLESAFFLVRDCRQRTGRTQQAFQDVLRGKTVRLDALYGAGKEAPRPQGCYFCSRPLVISRYANVKVRIDSEVRDVASCKICKEELETTKKVKVLYFMKAGKPVHWSEVADYVPSEDFWNINRKDAVMKTRKLELIVTQPEP